MENSTAEVPDSNDDWSCRYHQGLEHNTSNPIQLTYTLSIAGSGRQLVFINAAVHQARNAEMSFSIEAARLRFCGTTVSISISSNNLLHLVYLVL